MNQTMIQPYLFFGGRCEEALAFYQKCLGARTEFVMRYRESPDAPPPGMLSPGWEDKIMHCSFVVGETRIMASDGSGPEKEFKGFSLSITLPNEQEAGRVFTALSDGGKVFMPLTKTFWSPCFGMVTDRFGIQWMVTVPGQTV